MTRAKHNKSLHGHAASGGFTLIESIIVVVVLSIAAVTVAQLAGNIFNSQANNKTLQVGMQLMQECAEHVLATRRSSASGYGYAVTPSCASLQDPASLGFSKPIVVTPVAETTTGTFDVGSVGCLLGGSCGCPSSGHCKLVTITVSTTGGDQLAPIALLLVGP